ncbi:MAG: SH3 domain-containing protein [Candidatus Krumholzibacteria bacterium]|nr:SH3 domain-containing protein [Candidatus Krumholzibacteria bacterium]MDH4337846.1 SH3 domain-containing protein [Candidatus Krumholzibacteria bacterium]MDH5270613.1 SH3 domain-containing protein [Candidatus Krumholzibacteria bacterium]
MDYLARKTVSALSALAILATAVACASSGGGGAAGDGTTVKSRGPRGPERVAYLEDEIARLQAERDRLAQTNVVLEDELRWAHDDLKLVERQFSEFEHRLTEDFGKAAAVAASAEARIHLQNARQTVALPDSSIKHITSLLETAEQLIRTGNYPAALFFAERANHTLQGAERRASLNVQATTMTVIASTANVREGPGQQYEVRATLRKGERVSCLDLSRNWCHVVTVSGASGWIHASLLQ